MQINLGNTPINVVETNSKYGVLYCIEDDAVVSKNCIPPNYWEEALLKGTYPYWKDADLILDIGSHIGSHSLYFSTFNSKAQIHAFEPVYHEITQLTFKSNSINGVVHSYGLSNEEKVLSIVDPREHGDYRLDGPGINFGHATVSLTTQDKSNAIQVNLRSLDSLAGTIPATDKNKCFIKLDVEHHEPFVLRGGKCFIETNRPVIWFEEWSKDHETSDLLISWNYVVRKLGKMDYLAIPSEECK